MCGNAKNVSDGTVGGSRTEQKKQTFYHDMTGEETIGNDGQQ